MILDDGAPRGPSSRRAELRGTSITSTGWSRLIPRMSCGPSGEKAEISSGGIMSTAVGRFGRPGVLACSGLLAAIAVVPPGASAAAATQDARDPSAGAATEALHVQGTGANRGAALEEVVVTAQKLRERTLDVPMSLT